MTTLQARSSMWFVFGLGLLSLSDPALAYMGPGAGLTMIGTLVALVSAILAGIFGFVWYPMKRLLKRRKQDQGSVDEM
jgi:hypothetical protein